MSRYTRTNEFIAGQKARGSDVQAELDAVQQWSEDMPDSDDVWSGNVNFVEASGTGNAITVAAPNTWTAYTGKNGYKLSIKIASDNTGAVTLNVDGLGAKAVSRNDGSALQAGDLKQNGIYDFAYNEAQEKFNVSAINGIAVAAAASAAAAAASAAAALTSQNAASASETAAAGSASSASTSASAASTSATNASNSATTAGTNATNAATSASAAATSATSASTSASTATTQASNASTSATNAAASATAAGTSATNAANSETAAAASASSASTSASTASTQASNAATSATNASTSASTATTKASEADASATAAAGSATSASGSATTATTQASNAASSATAAAGSATTATTKAGEASASATAALASENAAAASLVSTNAARDATLAALDSFDDRYLGQKTSDPTLDNDGNALATGALYFNTVTGVMKVYDGANWLAAYASLAGALLVANNLSDLTNTTTARTNLGLGTAATANTTAFATAAQGSTADSALQPAAIGVSIQAYSAILAATTASFLSADRTKLDGIEAGADVTDTANVTAAGALMDSEVDANLKTLTLPASVTISSFAATILDDADAATVRATIGAGTGSGSVTSVALSVPTGLSVSGSPITTSGTFTVTFTAGYAIPTTAKQTEWDTAYGWGDHSTEGYLTSVSLTTNVTGVLPAANGGTNNAFFQIAGPATSTKTYTFANSSVEIVDTTTSQNIYAKTLMNYKERENSITGTSPAISGTDGPIRTWTLTGNSTPSDSMSDGESITMMIDDGSAYTVTWTSLVDVWLDGAAPTLETTGYTLVVAFKVGGTVYGFRVGS